MTSAMKMTKEEIQRAIKFFKILHQINCRIKLTNPRFSPGEADEGLNQNEPTKLHRRKTNSRISRADN
jgi:RNase H-fold protein (predicted Holliday junction resolvase)